MLGWAQVGLYGLKVLFLVGFKDLFVFFKEYAKGY